ncbi:MAG: TetR family transcriptional regulator [Rhodobacteraceae bacterium]|jgi:TetR/AcrR family transcriptional regulator|nr:TetR family transcriptional regulator [Paracoccaceae bacterium]
MQRSSEKPLTRIQKQNISAILEAALEVFSVNGFRGSTLDQIACAAGISKPNLLYYFNSKQAIHVALLSELLDAWLYPLRDMNPNGDAKDELMNYVRRKLDLSRNFPRESRLFANEIVQGAPRIDTFLKGDLKNLVDEKAKVISGWMDKGLIARFDPHHLIFSIWALTQHYADFEAQTSLIMGKDSDKIYDDASIFLEAIFEKILA